MLFDTSKKFLSDRDHLYNPREATRGKALVGHELTRMIANEPNEDNIKKVKKTEYNIVFENVKAIIFLLHTQFTTCITVRNAMNLLPHLSKPFCRKTSANCSI